MNKDQHEESEAEAFKPPPKMSDLMGGSTATAPNNPPPNIPAMAPTPPTEHRNEPNFGSYASPNSMPAPTAVPAPNSNNLPMPPGNNGPDAVANKVPSLQSNMFKMQRNKSESVLCSSIRDITR